MIASALKGGRVDARVADSPLVALRYHIDARIADLTEAGEKVERDRIEAAALGESLSNNLRRNEEARREMLEALDRHPAAEVERAFRDGLVLAGELGLVDEQLASLQRRRDDLASDHEMLTQVRAMLRAISDSGGLSVDGRAIRLSQAARGIYQIVDEEHDAVASAILDGPMQRLADAALEAELVRVELPRDMTAAAESAARCHAATVDAAARLQQRIERLRPVDREQSLVRALANLLAAEGAETVGPLQVVGVERRLDPFLELSAYRIVEAALDNALRHGEAARVDVVIAFHADRLVVLVTDNGDGFDVVGTEARLGRTRGLGLIEMHERAALAGGRVEVRSVTGEGTEVRAHLPFAG